MSTPFTYSLMRSVIRAIHPRVRKFLWLSVIGTLLLTAILQAELLLLPEYLETPGRLLYRGAFFLIAPIRPIVWLFIPRDGHHWPLSHFIVACFGTPYFLWGLYLGGRRLFQRLQRSSHPWNTLPQRPKEGLLNRRQFLTRSATGAGSLAMAGVGSYAYMVEPNRLQIRPYEVPIHGLPAALDGIRLAHVSDTHYGPFTGLPYLREVAEEVNRLNPDLVVFTGDHVHFTPDSVEPGIGQLADYTSRMGSVAVMGNHEHWEGTEACRTAFRKAGIQLVENTHLFLTPEGLSSHPNNDAMLCIAGVGDLWEDEVSFDNALAKVPEFVPRVMLSHNPDAAEQIGPLHRVDLMLSGHTHGGQVHIPFLGSPPNGSDFGERYLGGLCQGPACPVIVSRGVGTSFMPIRFRVPPEVGLITLRAV